MCIICNMASPSGHPPHVAGVELEGQPQELFPIPHREEPVAAIDQALQSTEAALGALASVVVESIRLGGDVSPQVEAAERDLRSALRQLSLAQRHARRPASASSDT